MVKLLHITSSLKIGGAEHVLHTIIANLDPQKFDQEVIYFHEGPYVEKIRMLGIRTHHVRGLLFRYDPVFFWRLYRTIKKLNPDCLHTLLWVANFAGRLCAWAQGIACVSVFHNDVAHDGKMRNLLDRLTLRFADRLVAVSEPVAESVRNRLDSRAIIGVIHNGIELNPSAVAKAMADAVDTFMIGSVGRFEPVKRYDLLLECVAALHARHPQVRLCLIGLGSQEEFLRNRARELGIEHIVQFVIGQPALPYYPQFDCFAQTTAKEGISIALLEAMSCGVPSVVMHDTPDHPVIRHMRDGMVVDASDVHAFERAIEDLMANEILARQLGDAGRARIQKDFGAQRMVEEYKRLFIPNPFVPKN